MLISINPSRFFKYLGHDDRLRILLLLQKHKRLFVSQLVSALGLSQPKTSRHLAALKQGGVLLDERDSRRTYYCINPDLPDWTKQVLVLALKHNHDYLQVCLQRLSQHNQKQKRLEKEMLRQAQKSEQGQQRK